MKNNPILQLKNLSFSYGNKLIIDNFCLSLNRGEWLSILGQSGIGKSTILKLICNELTPDSGSIKSLELPAYLSQNPLLLPWLTVEQNIAFKELSTLPWLKKRKVSKEKQQAIDQIISEMGLRESRTKLPVELSGGMSQRVAIGRILFLKRKFWILDEPFSKLDILTKRDIYFKIKKIAKDNSITVLLITHDIDEALQLSDNILCCAKKPITTTESYIVNKNGLSDRVFEFSDLKFKQKEILIEKLALIS